MWNISSVQGAQAGSAAWADGTPLNGLRGPEGSRDVLLVGGKEAILFEDIGDDAGYWAVRLNGSIWHYQGQGALALTVGDDGTFTGTGEVGSVAGSVRDRRAVMSDEVRASLLRGFEADLFPLPSKIDWSDTEYQFGASATALLSSMSARIAVTGQGLLGIATPASTSAFAALANRVAAFAIRPDVNGVGGSMELDLATPGPQKLIGTAMARCLTCRGPAWGPVEGSTLLCLILIACTPPDMWGMGPVNRSATEGGADAITWIS